MWEELRGDFVTVNIPFLCKLFPRSFAIHWWFLPYVVSYHYDGNTVATWWFFSNAVIPSSFIIGGICHKDEFPLDLLLFMYLFVYYQYGLVLIDSSFIQLTITILSFILMLKLFQNQQVAVPFVMSASLDGGGGTSLFSGTTKAVSASSYTVLAPESIISLSSPGPF